MRRSAMRRAAVVVNPTKHGDLQRFKTVVGKAMSDHGPWRGGA
jgi:hypothetical protein